MITQSDHRESWTIEIKREADDTWPDLIIGIKHKRMRPERIEYSLHRGDDHVRVHVRGVGYLKNGQPGRLELADNWCTVPWVMALVHESREQLHLGPGQHGGGLGMTIPGDPAEVATIVAAAAGCAIHFAVLPENEAAFLAYLNLTRSDGEQIPPWLLRRLMAMVHDIVALDCDVQLGVE